MNTATLFRKWSHWLDRIEKQQLRDLLINHHIFKQPLECTAPYVGTQRGAELQEWMVQNYVAFAATAVRRLIEKPNKHWKSVSLRILLEDMKDNASDLTRARYRRRYKHCVVPTLADEVFDRIAGKKRASHLSVARIQRDIKAIEKACAPIERLVNKVVAHTEEDQRKIGKVKWGQIDQAIDLLSEMYDRYSQLVKGSACDLGVEDIDVREYLHCIWPRKE